MAGPTWWLLTLVCSGCLIGGLGGGAAGDADPLYRKCVERCERTGQAGDVSSSRHCSGPSPSVHGVPAATRSWYSPDTLHARWRLWNCKSDCRRSCVMQRETHREKLGLDTVKYHGKWPHRRAALLQESIATALPVLNLATQLHGWLSFSRLLRRRPAPPRSQGGRRRSYEYAGLMHVYALLAMNAWFWSAVCHAREFELTEQLDYTSAVALVGYSLILAVYRTFGLKDEASRVVVAAPLLGFVMTHICYLLFADLDYEFNAKVCNVMGTAQLLLWSVWAGARRHPSRLKVWVVGLGGGLAVLLEAYDFPPYGGCVDGRTLWHAASVPLTCLWWSFVKDDARYGASALGTKKLN